MLGFLPVTNEDGEDDAPDAPFEQSSVMPDGSMQPNASPDLITLHDYLTCTTASGGRGSCTRILHSDLRESLRPFINYGGNVFQSSGVIDLHWNFPAPI